MRKYNIKNTQGNWVTHPDDPSLKFKIRPLSLINLNQPPTTEAGIKTNDLWEWFNYICMEWEGFIDEDNKKLECNDKNKELVFNFDQEIVGYIIDQSNIIRDSIIKRDELKN